jgi:hypothetical protein
MNDFSKGMNSIGQLFPTPYSYTDYPSYNQAWGDVAKSFFQAGNSLRAALKDFQNAQSKNKQAN